MAGVRFNLLPGTVGQSADGYEVERHPEDEKAPYNYNPSGFLRGNAAVLVPNAVVQQNSRAGVKSQASRRQVQSGGGMDEWDMDGLDDDALERDFPTRKVKKMSRRKEEEMRLQEEAMRHYQATQNGEEDDLMFQNADDAEFDVDFIQQMIYGEVGESDDEDRRLAGLDEFGMPKKRAKKSILKSGDAEEGDDEEEEEDEDFDEEDDYEWDDEEYEDDEETAEAAEKYNVHATDGRAIDRQYQRMLREFEIDATINNFAQNNEDVDPRTRGPLEIQQYVPLLQEFAEENAGYSQLSDDPLKHKGLINQLRGMTRENRVFDTDQDGEYKISILPDKATRKRMEFRRDAEGNKELTLKFIKQQEEARQRGLVRDVDASAEHAVLDRNGNRIKERDEELPKRFQQRYDCETILTTASTAFNHPNIIVVAGKKKLNMKEALRRAREGGFGPQKSAEANTPSPAAAASSAALPGTLTVHSSTIHADPNAGKATKTSKDARAESSEEEEEDDDEDMIIIDPTERPKGESKEEKRIRKEIVKQMQREKRMQKKVLGSAYKAAEGAHAKKAARTKQDKAQMSLSLARV